MVINKSINNHHSRLKCKRKQEPTDSRASTPLFFWRRLLIWIIRAVVLMTSQDKGAKSQGQGFPTHLLKGLWIRGKLAPPTTSPMGLQGARSPWSAVRRKEKRENLSLGGCHHRLARSHTYSLNGRWGTEKSEGGQQRQTVCVPGSRHTVVLPALHTNTQALTSSPLHGLPFPCKHLCGLWGGMAQVQILTLPLTSWVTLDKSVCPFPHLKNGDNYKTSLRFIVRLRWVHVYGMFRTVSGIQGVIIWSWGSCWCWCWFSEMTISPLCMWQDYINPLQSEENTNLFCQACPISV